jgi:hypothetical protein
VGASDHARQFVNQVHAGRVCTPSALTMLR